MFSCPADSARSGSGDAVRREFNWQGGNSYGEMG
jgi:hypothetical protein